MVTAEKTGPPSHSSDDYSLSQVPESERQSTLDISLVRMGLTVSASDLVFGYTLGLYFTFWTALGVAAIYSTVIAVVSILMGIIGVRERTTFALTSRFAFGREGSRLPSLVLALVIAVFYGYILGITIDVFPHIGSLGPVVYSVALGAVFLGISALGFTRGLRWVARAGVPLMIVLVLIAVAVTVNDAGGFGAIVHAHPKAAGKMTFGALVGLGVAKWLAGAIITPDVMRFGKGYRSVVISTAAEFFVGNLGFNLLGLVLGLGLGASDLGKAFGIIGLTWLASVTFVIQSITVEMNELYAASLAVSNAARVRRGVTNVVVGVAGIAIGWYGVSQGIIASFLTFINWIGYALPIIPAIIIADYYIVQRMRYPYGFSEIPAVNWRAMVAFVVTLGLNIYLGVSQDDTLWHSLPLIGIVVYLVVSIPHMFRGRRSGPHGTVEPSV